METKQISVVQGSTLELLVYSKDGFFKKRVRVKVK